MKNCLTKTKKAMKVLNLIPVIFVFILTSCSTVRVASDYDKDVNFTTYKTFAFYRPGIDKAQISDLDKKRILRAIEANLLSKGMTKSETPDLLVSIFTKERERVDVFNDGFGVGWGWGWSWGWGPWWNGGFWGSTVSQTVEGTLYIDFLDGKTKELVWQGIGTSSLINYKSVEKRTERINKIVSEILERYPPENEK